MSEPAVRNALRRLASTRFTLAGMVLLSIGAALSYDNPVTTPVWVLVIPLALLSANLLAAIATNRRINRRGGLLVFHLALLGLVVLAAVGRLTRLEAHIEMVEGDAFSPHELIDVHKGPWHSGPLDRVRFVQGPYTVDYAPSMVRGPTRSRVWIPDGRGGWKQRVIGDDKPLVLEGYRFYTTFNKGFAPVLTWTPDGGAPLTGTVHMPSYPLFDFRQANRWTPPHGREIRFWLRLDTGLTEKTAWTLDRRHAHAVLVVITGDRRIELQAGGSVRLGDGTLRYEHLSSWMGYKVFYDPTLPWMFVTALLGVLGLAAHLGRKLGVLSTSAAIRPAGQGTSCPERPAGRRALIR